MWSATVKPLPGPGSFTSSCRGGTLSGVLGVLGVVVACFAAPHLLRPNSPSGSPSPGTAEDTPSAARRSHAAAPVRRTNAFRQVQLSVPEGMLTGCKAKFTMEQVLRHDSMDDDCWVIVHGKVRLLYGHSQPFTQRAIRARQGTGCIVWLEEAR